MVQIFHPAWNTLSKASIFGAIFFLGGALWLSAAIHRSPYITQEGVVRAQPVSFSHKHHVQGLGIDCRHCHTTVEEGAFAGIPSTKTCMTCHSVVWSQSELLAPVRESFQEDRPIEWTRVHDLPDFVYFDHSAHVAKGIGCSSCHGEVDEMPLMWQESSLQMEWCLSCHRDPKPFIRPRERVFDMDYEMPLPPSEAVRLMEEYDVQSLTNCSICHR